MKTIIILIAICSILSCATVDKSRSFKLYDSSCIEHKSKDGTRKANCWKRDDIIVPSFEVTYVDGRWLVTDIFY